MSSLRDRLARNGFERSADHDFSSWSVHGGDGEAAAAVSGTTSSLAALISAMSGAVGPVGVSGPPIVSSSTGTGGTGTDPVVNSGTGGTGTGPVVNSGTGGTGTGPVGGTGTGPIVNSGTGGTGTGPVGSTGTGPTGDSGTGATGGTGGTGTNQAIQDKINELKAKLSELDTAIADIKETLRPLPANSTDRVPIESQLRILQAERNAIANQIKELESTKTSKSNVTPRNKGTIETTLGDSAAIQAIQDNVTNKITEFEALLVAKKEKQKELEASDASTELEKAVIKDEINALDDKIKTLKEGAFIDVLGDRYHMGKHEIMSGRLVMRVIDVSDVVKVSDVSEMNIDLADANGVMSFQQFLINYGIHAQNKINASDSDILPQVLLTFKKFFTIDTKKRSEAKCTPEMLKYVYPYLVYRRGTLARHVLMYTDDNGDLYLGGQHFMGLYEGFDKFINTISLTCASGGVTNNQISPAAPMDTTDIMAMLRNILAEIKALKGCDTYRKCLADPATQALIKQMLTDALGGLTPEQIKELLTRAGTGTGSGPGGSGPGGSGSGGTGSDPGGSGGPNPPPPPPPPPPPRSDIEGKLADVLKFLDLSVQLDDPRPAGLFSMTATNADKDFYNANNAMKSVLDRRGDRPNKRKDLMQLIVNLIGQGDYEYFMETVLPFLENELDGIEDKANKLSFCATAIRSAQHALGYLNAKQADEARIRRLPLSLSRVMNKVSDGVISTHNYIGTTMKIKPNEPFLFQVFANNTKNINNIKNSFSLGNLPITKGQFYSFIQSKSTSSSQKITMNSASSNTNESSSNTFIETINNQVDDNSTNPDIDILTKRQIELYMLGLMALYILISVDDANERYLLGMIVPQEDMTDLAQQAVVSGLTGAITAASSLTAATAAASASAPTPAV